MLHIHTYKGLIKSKAEELMLLKTVVLEKTLVRPLYCKEMKSVNPKGNQS